MTHGNTGSVAPSSKLLAGLSTTALVQCRNRLVHSDDLASGVIPPSENPPGRNGKTKPERRRDHRWMRSETRRPYSKEHYFSDVLIQLFEPRYVHNKCATRATIRIDESQVIAMYYTKDDIMNIDTMLVSEMAATRLQTHTARFTACNYERRFLMDLARSVSSVSLAPSGAGSCCRRLRPPLANSSGLLSTVRNQ